jgi:upstream activation factor subunit UAF30
LPLLSGTSRRSSPPWRLSLSESFTAARAGAIIRRAAVVLVAPRCHVFRGEKMAKSAKKTSGRKPNAAFMKPVSPSPALAEVVGPKPIPRTEVTKRLWAYIKKNKLQDAKNKRMIKADDTLKTVFGGKASVNMFEMTKLVSKHLK